MLCYENIKKGFQFVGYTSKSSEGQTGQNFDVAFRPGMNFFKKDSKEYVFLTSKIGRSQLKKHTKIREVKLEIENGYDNIENISSINAKQAIKLVNETFNDVALKDMLKEEKASKNPRVTVVKAIDDKLEEILPKESK